MFFSRMRSWCVQRVASIGFVSIIVLVYVALASDHPPPILLNTEGSLSPAVEIPTVTVPRLTIAQWIFICYTVVAHILGFTFPMRLCWATYSITKKLRHASAQQISNPRPRRRSMRESKHHDDGYEASVSSFSESSSSSVFSDSTDESSPERESVSPISTTLHTIIIPNYKEDLDTLRETLEVLACHRYARSTYEICLAMEQAEDDARTKGAVLVSEYSNKFRNVDFTIHPKGIEGEAQGKSSNLCWAARYINGKHIEYEDKQNMIITVVDSDSHLSTSYFEMLNSMHQEHPQTAHSTVYVPPIIFDRNAHLVPSLVRVADVLWAGAGLSGHYDSSSICPPTSVYSLSLALVDRVGGWDAGGEAIGEDLHMYLKIFFALDGNLTTRTILSAASHSNVHTGFPGIRGFYRNIKARYNQALRHMWGALDSGYAAKSATGMRWRSGKDMDDRILGPSCVEKPIAGIHTPHWVNTSILVHRMYEAHFLPTHITILIIAGTIYTLTTPVVLANPTLLYVLDITGYIRIGSALMFGIFFHLYESYHVICVDSRRREMVRSGLFDRMTDCFSYRTLRNRLDYCLFPVAGMIFGSIPTVVALTMQLWTLNIVYKVSQKPLSWTAA